jgi:hypothetical protein
MIMRALRARGNQMQRQATPVLMMNESYRDHKDDEALERFLLNMSSEEELEILESHIIACGYCIERLETLETDIGAIRLALRQTEAVNRILKLE